MSDAAEADARNAGLIGYDDEVSAVVRSLVDEGLSGAVIIGGPEVGKTRTANTALARLGETVPVLRFVGSDYLADQAYGIFALLLAEEPQPIPPSPLLIHPAVRRILHHRYSGARPVVFVDNGHLVDEYSVSLLVQLIRERAITLVMTTESMRAPLDLVARLWTEGRLQRVELHGLGRKDSAGLLKEVMGAPVDSSTAGAVYEMTGGNPRLLRSLMLAQRDAGTVTLVDGVYVLAGAVDSTALAQMGLDRRLKRLPDHQRRVVELVVLAEAMPMAVLDEVAEGSTVDELAEMRIISISPGNAPLVRMVEPAGSERNFWSIQPARRRQLWDECLPHVDFDTLPEESLVGFARWAMYVGGELDAHQVTLAARAANTIWKMPRTIDLDAHFGARVPALRAEVVQSCLSLGWFDRADELMAEIEAEADSTPALAEPGLRARLRELEIRLADPRKPLRTSGPWARAQSARLSPADRDRITLAEVDFHIRGGQFAEAATLARTIDEDYGHDVRMRVRAGAQLGVARIALGDVEEGLRSLEKAQHTLDHPGLPEADRIDTSLSLFTGFYIAGAWDRVMAFDVSAASNFYPVPIAIAAHLIKQGRVAEGRSTLAPTLAALVIRDALGVRAAAKATDALGRALMGNDVGPPPEDNNDRPYHWFFQFEARRLGLLAWAHNEPAPAAAALHELGRAAEDTGARTCAVLPYVFAVRYGDDSAVDPLAQVSGGLSSRIGELGREYARGRAQGDPDSLVRAAELAVSFGEVVLGHAIATDAMEVATASGDKSAARRARTLAGRTYRRMRVSPRDAVELSELELTLAVGAAKGSTSQELGGLVHLSPRTVEWHLSRIYRRLHVANRSELRSVVSEWS